MGDRLAAELASIIENLAQAPGPIAPASLAEVAEHVAKGFGVGPDEVVLILTEQGKFLKFLIHEKLRTVGTIPTTSTTALAGRTAREKRAELVNNFTATRHASVFEGVPLGRRRGELIQKMMSAPIVAEGPRRRANLSQGAHADRRRPRLHSTRTARVDVHHRPPRPVRQALQGVLK